MYDYILGGSVILVKAFGPFSLSVLSLSPAKGERERKGAHHFEKRRSAASGSKFLFNCIS